MMLVWTYVADPATVIIMSFPTNFRLWRQQQMNRTSNVPCTRNAFLHHNDRQHSHNASAWSNRQTPVGRETL